MKCFFLKSWFLPVLFLGITSVPAAASQPVVPGTGTRMPQVGDDFEDPQWGWEHYWPKSSDENNKARNTPAASRRMDGGLKESNAATQTTSSRVSTPPNGLPGSKGSLLLRTLYTGIPGNPSYTQQQDDFICNVMDLLGGAIPVHQNPSFVTRNLPAAGQ